MGDMNTVMLAVATFVLGLLVAALNRPSPAPVVIVQTGQSEGSVGLGGALVIAGLMAMAMLYLVGQMGYG